VSPATYVATERPPRVRVVTQSGRRIDLRRPEVVGDSLVDSSRTTVVREALPVSVPRSEVADIRLLEADEERYRSIGITTVAGLQLQIDDPVFTSDSLWGTRVIDREHRWGIPLTDIRQILIPKVNWGLASVGIVAAAATVGLLVCAAACTFGM